MKFRFSTDIVVDARSIEDALNAIGSHIATVNRHVAGAEHSLEDCGAEFDIREVDEATEAVDLTDQIVQRHGHTKLNLDPESPEGEAYAKQQAVLAEAKRREELAALKHSRTDAENLAEHSANEQAELNKPATD